MKDAVPYVQTFNFSASRSETNILMSACTESADYGMRYSFRHGPTDGLTGCRKRAGTVSNPHAALWWAISFHDFARSPDYHIHYPAPAR